MRSVPRAERATIARPTQGAAKARGSSAASLWGQALLGALRGTADALRALARATVPRCSS